MQRRQMVVTVLVYMVLDWTSYLHPVAGLAITPWNPQTGLMVAAFLLWGRAAVPWFLLGNAVTETLLRDSELASLSWFISIVLPPVFYAYAAHGFRLWLGPDFHFRDFRDVLRWLAFALPTTAVTGLLYVTAQASIAALPWSLWADGVQRFWVGDWLGLVVVAPLLLTWRREPEVVGSGMGKHVAGIVLCTAVALYVILGDETQAPQVQFFYLLFLPLIWASLRFSLHGATAVLALIQVALVVMIMMRQLSVDVLVAFQLFLFVLVITGLFLGISVHERIYTLVTLRKREHELNRALNRASAGELASTLAHELNQPLTALSAYSLAGQTLAQQQPLDAERMAELLAKIRHESQRAGQVVHRLRRFFRSGELHCEALAIETAIASAWEPLLRRAEQSGVEFVLSDLAPLPKVYADRVQIEIVLFNLFRNALEAIETLASPITARVISVSAQTEDQHLRIIVTDTGCGIDETQHAHLFDALNTSKVEGLGLGLNICRTLVESHGGHLWLASSRQGHTRFCFTLPLVQDKK